MTTYQEKVIMQKINTPQFEPTPSEIQVAKARIFCEDYLFSMMTSLIRYYQLKEGKIPPHDDTTFYTPERITQFANEAVTLWNKKMYENPDAKNLENIWEHFVSDDFFQKHILDSLKEEHFGYCTGHEFECSRCIAETSINAPNKL